MEGTKQGFTGNPIIPDAPAADPTMVIFEGEYCVYPTGGNVTEPGFSVWTSTDLSNFKSEGMILKFSDLGWAKKDAWAPDIVERNGKYYFYFSADSSIGVAVSDSPKGPFVDALGHPLIDFEEDMSTIDPRIFIDDDGETYLYWGATFDGKLFMRKMNRDMISFQGEKMVVLDCKPNDYYHSEGSYLFKRKGLYYYIWSEYIWDEVPRLKTDYSYRLNWSVAEHPEGPFTRDPDRVPFLSSDAELKFLGPGHNSVLHLPGTDEYYVVYHQHDGRHNGRVKRYTNIDRLHFGEDGVIYTVKMTREGVPLSPIKAWIKGEEKGPYSSGTDLVFLLGHRLAEEDIMSVTLYANEKAVVQMGRDGKIHWENPQKGFYKVYAEVVCKDGEKIVTETLNVDVI